VLASLPGTVWQRPWVTFCKHYGQGNDAGNFSFPRKS
jgi:hypothetical protein